MIRLTLRRTEARPRYRSVPPGAHASWGDEAIAFAADIGITLDAGQAEILTDGMSLRENGLWLAQSVVDVEPRQNGKTAVFGVRALAGAFVLKEPLIVWTAHEFKTARQSFTWMKDMVENYDHLRKRVRAVRNSGAVTEIELLNPRRIVSFLARSGGSGRGFAQVSPLLMDEAYALSPEQVAALTFIKSAAPNPQIWYASSAPLKESAVLRELVKDGRAGRGRMVYYEWSATGKVRDLEKLTAAVKADRHGPRRAELLAAVAQANRAFPGRITEETIDDELSMVPVEQWVRERLGGFSELEEGGKISPDQWEEVQDASSRRQGDVSLAVDISIERDWAAVGMYGLREDGLGHSQVIRYEGGTDWIIGFLMEAKETLNPVAIGMAGGTYAALKNALKQAGFMRPEDRPIDATMRLIEGKSVHPPQRGDLIILNGTDMGAATGGYLEAVRDGTMRVVPADQLTQAARVGRVRTVGDAQAWMRTDTTVDITTLVSVTEAKWSHEARANEIEDYDPADDIW